MQKGQITELTLGGFQVFAERTTIPLGPLTLIFGPNSAGKSAIADGLQALARFCDLFDPTGLGWPDEAGGPAAAMLQRDWRIEPGSELGVAARTELGVRVLFDRTVWGSDAGTESAAERSLRLWPNRNLGWGKAIVPWLRRDGLEDLELQLSLSATEQIARVLSRGRTPNDFIEWRANVSIGGNPILRFESLRETAINIAHPMFGGQLGVRPLERLAQKFPDWFQVSAGWVTLGGGLLSKQGFDAGPVEYAIDADYEGQLDAADSDAIFAFGALFDILWMRSIRSVRSHIHTTLVPASRTIPSRQDLTYLMTSDGDLRESRRLGIQTNGREEYLSLAQGALESKLGFEDALGKPASSEHRIKLDFVNRLLAEHLFKETGYFVTAAVNALVPIRSTGRGEGIDEEAVGTSMPDYLVTLELQDVGARRLAFDEVGSGLGYVLPVLVALADGDTKFIQQPELHLHPALQAELADALIAGLKNHSGAGRQLIVETHSEHLLLRLLRRLRQTKGDRAEINAYALKSNELVILYVNPSLSGTSTVKRLRVDPDGDFLDRWPRGFFEERWKELFDE